VRVQWISSNIYSRFFSNSSNDWRLKLTSPNVWQSGLVACCRSGRFAALTSRQSSRE